MPDRCTPSGVLPLELSVGLVDGDLRGYEVIPPQTLLFPKRDIIPQFDPFRVW